MVVILIAATAFFVAAEFAVVKVRPTLINQLASEGNKRAIAAQKVISNLDGYLSACQLGITITALGLGVIGEPAVGELLKLVFQLDNQQLAATVSHVTAFTLITFLHVVVGELAPKTWAIQKAERISLWFSPLLIAFYKIMYPFIWLLNGSANILVKMFGLQPAKEHDLAHTEEELRQILTHSLDRGEINRTEYEYVTNIFEFDERIAREIMVPRTEMACVYTNLSLEENMEIIKKEGYTRFPVAEEDKDHIIGFIHVKELFMKYMENPAVNIQDLIRPIIFANESTPIKTLMGRMQKERNPMAVLVDEYGGTAGIVTLEDILEEIVGEIRDEFDTDEIPELQIIEEGHYMMDGKFLLEELAEMTGIEADPDFDTIGGWVSAQILDVEAGKSFEADGWLFTVKEVDGLQIKRVEVKKLDESDLEIGRAHV